MQSSEQANCQVRNICTQVVRMTISSMKSEKISIATNASEVKIKLKFIKFHFNLTESIKKCNKAKMP